MSEQAGAAGANGAGAGQAGGAGAGANGIGVGAGAGTGGAASDWTSGLNDELKGWVQAKGFKDSGSAIDGYRNAEKLITKLSGGTPDQILLMPKDGNLDPVYDRLGRPKTSAEYKFSHEKEGAAPDDFGKWARDTFHKNGLNQKQAEAIVSEWGKFAEGMTGKQKDAQNAKYQEEAKGLQTEWGQAYEQNAGIVDRAAVEFGMTEQQLSALREVMGGAGAMKFLHNIGSKLGESSFVVGDGKGGAGGIKTPAGALSELNAVMNDPGFRQRYASGDAQARKQFADLNEAAFKM